MRDRQVELTLCEDEAGLVVNLEDFLDGIDVCRRPQVQTQVVLVGCPHDLLHERESRMGEDRGFIFLCTKFAFSTFYRRLLVFIVERPSKNYRCDVKVTPVLAHNETVCVCVRALPWQSAPW